MNWNKVIRSIMSNENVSQAELAKRAGYKRQSNITGMLTRYKTIRIDSFDNMLRALGYKIVVMPQSQKTPKGAIEVTVEEETE